MNSAKQRLIATTQHAKDTAVEKIAQHVIELNQYDLSDDELLIDQMVGVAEADYKGVFRNAREAESAFEAYLRKHPLSATTVTAAILRFAEPGFDPKEWDAKSMGKDGKGNTVYLANDSKRWMVVIHSGEKMIAYLDAKDKDQAEAAAKKAVKEKSKTYWASKDPLENYYLNSAGRLKVTIK